MIRIMTIMMVMRRRDIRMRMRMVFMMMIMIVLIRRRRRRRRRDGGVWVLRAIYWQLALAHAVELRFWSTRLKTRCSQARAPF